jgi:hypothetical protein
MYILFDTDKDYDLLQDRPVLSTGSTPPWETKPQLPWLQPKCWRHDRQLQSNSDSDSYSTLHMPTQQ